ncbi:MAG: hypothetical protein APF77_03770 [Clostridia bacterium BRH_c25]|nr:MAG: hypothetical protein APF77_03770 [Clostridia bacterium BRH_c25]
MKRKVLVSKEIEDLRMDLETIIEEEKELINPKVVNASQSLDKVLIQYYRMLGTRGLRMVEEGAE